MKPPEKTTPSSTQLEKLEKTKNKDSGNFYSPLPAKTKITFQPPRQVLHRHQNLVISIDDPEGIRKDSKWRLYFNGYDVTHQLLPQITSFLSEDRQTLELKITNLRLNPHKENQIEVAFYHSKNSPAIIDQWKAPKCSLYDNDSVKTTENFKPSTLVLAKIEKWSKKHQFNPSLVAGLIAQESKFNSQTVSWDKAIGLTQITPIGDLKISKVKPKWPRKKQINSMPSSVVKAMVHMGKVTAKQDWRLNPELSIRGGLTLLQHMKIYWLKGENFSLLENKLPQIEKSLTPVILASHHSGTTQVKRAIHQFGPQFLNADYLGETKKYVNRINSYCYHFAHNTH